MSNFQKIILGIAIATMFVSYCLGANVLIQSVHGFFLVISVLIIAAAIKSGEGIFAHLATGYFLEKKYFLSAFFAGLCALLLAVSVSGTTMFLLIQHKKDTAKLETAKEFLQTKEKDVEFAQQELHACNPAYITKCVTPKTKNLNEKIAERDEAAKKFAKYSDAKGIDTAWHEFSDFVGISSDDEISANTEIFRNLALATLADVIAMILIAVVHLEFFKSETKEENKKPNRMDDYIEPDFKDYKQPERNLNREPIKSPVNYQPLNDWQPFSFEEEKKDVVKFIMDLPAGRSVAIIGSSGFGKSQLLGALALESLDRGYQTFVIDPHFNITESAFDPRCEIIGKSTNAIAEIKNFIFWLKSELDRREKELKTIPYAQESWPVLVVLMDEMFEVINTAGLTKEFALMYAKMRKYKIVFLGISQAFNVRSMGVEGNKDLLLSFDIFQMSGADNDFRITHQKPDPVSPSLKRIDVDVYEHPNPQLSFSHFEEQKNFKPVIDKIIKQPAKSLNGDIFQ